MNNREPILLSELNLDMFSMNFVQSDQTEELELPPLPAVPAEGQNPYMMRIR